MIEKHVFSAFSFSQHQSGLLLAVVEPYNPMFLIGSTRSRGSNTI